MDDASYPIGPNPPKSVPWQPMEILYSRLCMKDPKDPTKAHLDCQKYVIEIPLGEPDPVAAFVKLRASNPMAPIKHSGAYPNPNPKKGPCDIYLENQGY